MSWIDKIRSIMSENNGESNKETSVETPIEALNFEDIPLFLEEKTGKISKREAEIRTRIVNRINELGENLDKGINQLSKVNLDKRKEEERLMSIVKESSLLYTSLLIRLNSKLKEVSENNEIGTKELLEKVALNLNEFYKVSANPFQRSTILIGQEMENLKKTIKSFSDGVIAIERENESFFKEFESIKNLKNNLSELKESKKQQEEITNLLGVHRNKIFDINDTHKEIEEEIKRIMESRDYEEDMNNKEKKKNQRKEIEIKIQGLKADINLKELKKKYHSIEEKHEIVKRYSDNFTLALTEDKDLEFKELLIDESQKAVLGDLRDVLIESVREFSTKNEEKIKSLSEMRRSTENEIKTIELDIEALNKKKDKLADRENKLKEDIKSLAQHLK